MTPLEDKMYVALMAARATLQPLIRGDVRQQASLAAVDNAIKLYQDARNPPPGPVVQKMDWDATTEIQQ